MLQMHCSGVGIHATAATAVFVTNGTAGRYAYAQIWQREQSAKVKKCIELNQ